MIDPTYLVMVLLAILISMTLHEAMHGYTAFWLGDDTAEREGRLTLNPLKHIDPFLTILLPVLLAISGGPIFGGAKPVPFNPNRVRYGDFGAALVGLAGPLTNLLLSFIFFGIYVSPLGEGAIGEFLKLSILVNIGFFVFNMIPLPPLDGSRILYAVAPQPIQRLMELMEQYGLVLVFALVFLFSQQIGQFMVASQQVILSFYAALFGV